MRVKAYTKHYSNSHFLLIFIIILVSEENLVRASSETRYFYFFTTAPQGGLSASLHLQTQRKTKCEGFLSLSSCAVTSAMKRKSAVTRAFS